ARVPCLLHHQAFLPGHSRRLEADAVFFIFFNDTAPTEIYTLSLHDALPISALARHDMNSPPKDIVTSLDRCAKEVAADFMPMAMDRGVDLGFEIIEPSRVRGEAAALSSVVHNLIDNALRHTPQGGRVDIGIYHEGARVILQIEDTGPA